MRILYSRNTWTEGVDAIIPSENIWGWVDLTRFDDKEGKVTADTPLLVNIKGCGYAPDINCGSFANKYQACNSIKHCGKMWGKRVENVFKHTGPL